ncbi:MAG: carboxypeptidase-like regulatory domain-containing protein [Flavobacteriales bacterium]
MTKFHALFLALIIGISASAQDSCDVSIRVTLTSNYYDETPEYGVVATADDGQNEIMVASEGWYLDFKNLKPGIYELTFRSMKYHTIVLKDVKVEADKVTYLNVELSWKDDMRFCNEECEEDYPMRFFWDLDYFHPNYPAVNSGLKEGYQFRVTGWSDATMSDRFDFGVLYAFKWGVQRLDSMSQPLVAIDANRPRLGWFKYGFGFGATWVLRGHETAGQEDDFFVNAGVTYDIPIVFRYKENLDGARIVKPRIHKWNEFNVEARMIYRYVGVNASYRLTEYIKGDFPELPRWWFGVSFAIPFEDE